MVVRFAGNDIELIPVHLLKASPLIILRLGENTMDFRFTQLEKAKESTTSTVDGITNSPLFVVEQLISFVISLL